MENKIEHLKMIESIIERMAKNSFQLKGWAMTLVTLVGALSANDADKRFIILAFIPIIVFWLLDSFYLQQERRYKALYRETTENNEKDTNFNLNTRLVKYTNNEAKRTCFYRCMFSFCEVLFYGALTGTLLVLIIILEVF